MTAKIRPRRMGPQRASRHESNVFRGQWRITSITTWELEGAENDPPELRFGPGLEGELLFIGINATIDYRVVLHDGVRTAEFSWAGEA